MNTDDIKLGLLVKLGKRIGRVVSYQIGEDTARVLINGKIIDCLISELEVVSSSCS